MTRAAIPAPVFVPWLRWKWVAATLRKAGADFQAERQTDGMLVHVADPQALQLVTGILTYRPQAKRRVWFRFHFQSGSLTLISPVWGFIFAGPVGAVVALLLTLGVCHLDARRDADPAPYGRWFWAAILALLGLLGLFVLSVGYWLQSEGIL